MSIILRPDDNMQALDSQARQYSQQPEVFMMALDAYEERITPTGLRPVGDLGDMDFLFLGFYIQYRQKALTWAWADWLNIAMTRWGENFEQIASYFKYQDDDWLSRLARTAAFYQPSERIYDVSITHYAEAATPRLDSQQRRDLLEEAAHEKLTVGSFRDKIVEVTTPQIDSGQIVDITNQMATIAFQTRTLQFDLNRGHLYLRPTAGARVTVKFTQDKDGQWVLHELRPWQPPPQQFNYSGPSEIVARHLEQLARRIRDEFPGQRVAADGKIVASGVSVIDNQKRQ